VIVVVVPWCESLPWFCVMVSKVGVTNSFSYLHNHLQMLTYS
jgi:hypothetical protein